MACLRLDPNNVDDYARFLRAKSLPTYRVVGRTVEFPDDYLAAVDGDARPPAPPADYAPWPGLFDYQADIAALAVRKRKFAAFVRCGLGKTLIQLEWARAARDAMPGRVVLLLAPLMVVEQTVGEARRFYGDALRIEPVAARDLQAFLRSGSGVAITNYESLRPGLEPGRLGALSPDESSVMKSHYGRWGQELIRLGRGLDWKLALTGTPAPNDRIEFANHAVFLDAFPTVNSFLARFFVNKGQTGERWEMKPHAVAPFYRALSDWCIFLNDPATYGWRDNVSTIPPIHVHIEDVELDAASAAAVRGVTGNLIVTELGGIVSRGKLARIAKSGTSPKPAYIKAMVDSWAPAESTIIWCRHNDEQARLAELFPDAASIEGKTPIPRRRELIADFQAGRTKVLITKADVLGYGVNFQVATRHVFSGVNDSYEQFHQAVSRSNRVGSTRPLHVHVPVTEVERPMIENVLRKAARVEQDTEEQERIFLENRHASR